MLADMDFVLPGGGVETLVAGTFVHGVADRDLSADERANLSRRRRLERSRGHRGRVVFFEWGGRLRFGTVGVDLDPGR